MYNYRLLLLFYVVFFTLFHPDLSLASASSSASTKKPISPRTQALQTSVADPIILFNQALQFSKEQNFGLALAYLREVQLLAPRYAGTKNALDYVQHQLQAKGFRSEESFFDSVQTSFLNLFLLPEILTFHWILSLILLIVLSKLFREHRKARLQQLPQPTWRWPQWSITLIWCLATFLLVIKIIATADEKATMINSGPTALRSGPVVDAAELAQIPEGSSVSVIGFHDNWVQISSHNFPMGWVPQDCLLILTPEGFK